MRHAFIVLLVVGLSALCAGAAEKNFTARLSAEEFKAAGLDKLSEAERAQLDRLIAGEKLAAVTAAVAEVKAATPPAPAAEAKPARSSWVRLLPGTRIEYETVETSLVGEFRGWHGGTRFRLANGQVWKQIDSSTYATPPQPGGKVWIEPGALGSFFLRFDGIRSRVKVQLESRE